MSRLAAVGRFKHAPGVGAGMKSAGVWWLIVKGSGQPFLDSLLWVSISALTLLGGRKDISLPNNLCNISERFCSGKSGGRKPRGNHSFYLKMAFKRTLCCWYKRENLTCMWTQVGVDAASDSETTYKNMLSKLPSGQDALCSAYEAIEKTVHDVDAYVRVRYICVIWLL